MGEALYFHAAQVELLKTGVVVVVVEAVVVVVELSVLVGEVVVLVVVIESVSLVLFLSYLEKYSRTG
jgi:hypothetical protein